MRDIYFCALLLSCVTIIYTATHGEHTEHDTMDFYYDPVGKYLIARTFSSCYMSKLTAVEQDHVHTNTGMEDLEMVMLRDVLGKVNETRIYHDSSLPPNIQKWCGNRDLFLLERPLEGLTTTTSLLVATLVAWANCANHHTPVPGTEYDNVHFRYDPQGNYLISITTSRCFFVKLTRDEQDHVHTNTGMEDLELKMLREMLGTYPETKIYHDDAMITPLIQRWCANQDIYQLQRSLEELMTTTPNIIG